METKLTTLTASNVRALNAVFAGSDVWTACVSEKVSTTLTTATFHCDSQEAIRLVEWAQAEHPRYRRSLFAVLRKLERVQ